MNDFTFLKRRDELCRRQFTARLAQSMLGVSFAGSGLLNAQLPGKDQSKADAVIVLMMGGGMSHLDTFDPKPDNSEVMGSTQTIPSKITGEPFGESIPELAKLADKLAIVRSLYQDTADHEQATYVARTSYEMRPSIIHPSLGPWAQQLLGKRAETLPDSVTIGAGSGHPGRGFLGPEFSPIPIGDPNKGVPNMIPGQGHWQPDAVARYNDSMKRRLELTEDLDAVFREKVPHDKVKAYTQFYDETLKFLESEDLKLFDLDEEPDDVRARYGRTRLGQGALLAKRLVKGGVRFVEVVHGSWDTHVDNFNRMLELANPLDQAASNLINDLEAEGMLDRTMVVIATEFGRTPKINGNSGRDHHAQAYSCVLAGGGVRGGQVIGKSDKDGDRLESEPHLPKNFNATIGHALGLDLKKIIESPSGRPFQAATPEGEPIMQVFS